jgi:hypothetical protein
MRKSTFCLMIAALTFVPLSQANALCIYNGEISAKTTVAQEYADAHWVVRARLVSVSNHYPDETVNDPTDEPWVLYTITVEETFKGRPSPELKLYSERNSGGFYLERPSTGAHPGDEFLLFLNPIDQVERRPDAAAGSTMVNYSCGQSKPWGEVTAQERQALATLSGS